MPDDGVPDDGVPDDVPDGFDASGSAVIVVVVVVVPPGPKVSLVLDGAVMGVVDVDVDVAESATLVVAVPSVLPRPARPTAVPSGVVRRGRGVVVMGNQE